MANNLDNNNILNNVYKDDHVLLGQYIGDKQIYQTHTWTNPDASVTLAGTIDLEYRPEAFVIDHEGNLIITTNSSPSLGNGRVVKYDQNGNKLWESETGTGSGDIIVNSVNDLYVTNNSWYFYRLNGKDGSRLQSYRGVYSNYSPLHIMLDKEEKNIYMSMGSDEIDKLSLELPDSQYGGAKSLINSSGVNQAVMALDNEGNLYTAGNTGVYAKWDKDGNKIWGSSTDFSNTSRFYAIAHDPLTDDMLLMNNNNSDSMGLSRYDSDRNRLANYGYINGRDIAIDKKGTIYTIDTNAIVEALPPSLKQGGRLWRYDSNPSNSLNNTNYHSLIQVDDEGNVYCLTANSTYSIVKLQQKEV